MKNILLMLAVLAGMMVGICCADYRDEIAAIEAETTRVEAESDAALAAADNTIFKCEQVVKDLEALNKEGNNRADNNGFAVVVTLAGLLFGGVCIAIGCYKS